MKKLISMVAVMAVVLCLAAISFAQTLPKYDPKTEVELKKVVVQDVKEITLPNGQNRFRLIVKVGDQLQEVCLCPKAFLETMDTAFAKGDELDVVGSKVDDAGKPLVLAREVVKGNNTLVLRDKKGEPVWTWMEKKPAEGK
jgi:hypothetical protein